MLRENAAQNDFIIQNEKSEMQMINPQLAHRLQQNEDMLK